MKISTLLNVSSALVSSSSFAPIQETIPTCSTLPSPSPHFLLTSIAKLVQAKRAEAGDTKTPLARAASTATTASGGSRGLAPPPSRSVSNSSSTSFKKKPPPPPPSTAPPPYSPSPNNGFGSRGIGGGAAAPVKKAPPPPPPVKPKPKPAALYVTALYDFDAQTDGDLSFKVGDRIEIVEKSDSTDDWWTGKLRGRQGVFPGMFSQLLHASVR